MHRLHPLRRRPVRPLLTILLSTTLSLSAPAQHTTVPSEHTTVPSEPTTDPTEHITPSPAPATYPWTGQAPDDVIRNALTPDLVLNETPGNWRPILHQLYAPLIRHCKTAREAVLTIASGITQTTGIHYTRQRRTPCMSALEALHEKKVSCTGQSIFLACALRSVGIPARVVGIRTWHHIPGNHTWVEAWFDGSWHMIEANERDFNTPWVMEYITLIDPTRPEQRIYAAQTDPSAHHLPIGRPHAAPVPSTDVTDRYLKLAREHTPDLPAGTQRLLIDIQPRPEHPLTIELLDEHGTIIATALLPTASDDMRRLTPFNLPRRGHHTLRLRGTTRTLPITPTPSITQILRLTPPPQGN